MASLAAKEETGRTKTKHMINSHFGDAYNLNAFKNATRGRGQWQWQQQRQQQQLDSIKLMAAKWVFDALRARFSNQVPS